MPVSNDPAALRQSLLAALQSKNFDFSRLQSAPGLTGGEVDRIVGELKQDGVTDLEVTTVVDTLVEALRSGYDTTSSRDQKSIGRLLDTLDRLKPGVIADKGSFTNNGAVSWMSLLQARASQPTPVTPTPVTPTPPVTTTPVTPTPVTPTPVTPTPSPTGTLSPLPAAGFSGASLTVSSQGDVVVAGRTQSLQLRGNPDASALLSLLKPGQLKGLDAAAKAALAGALLTELSSSSSGLPIDPAAPPKLQAAIASFAALGVLAELAPSLSTAQAELLLTLSGKTPSLMQEALLRRALEASTQTPAIAAAVAGFAANDAAASVVGEPAKLLQAYDSFRAEQGKAEWNDIKGPVTATALTCLAFAKGQAAVDNIQKGLAVWAKLDGASGFSADEAAACTRSLQPYIDNATATNLVFGAFVSDAPKQVAKAQNAAVVARIEPALSSSRPTLAGIPLSAEQATFVKTLLPGIKDDAAVTALGRALSQSHATFQTTTSTWGTPAAPREPLAAAAFAIFQRAAQVALEASGGNVDGMIDARSFESAIASEAKAIGDSVKPMLTDLSQGLLRDRSTTPAQNIAVSPQLAKDLTALLTSTTRSIMSAPNILAAALVVATKNGGALDGAGAAQLMKIISDYRGEFPTQGPGGAQLLDFNKLARIASFAVDGKAIPLGTINGQTVRLAELYTKVGEAVSASIDKADLRHAWMADRWGHRAKISVELVDVIAQKTSEGRGPIAVLQQQFPNAKIDIIASGRDGEHQRFLYQVATPGQAPKLFNEASDGAVKPYDERLQGKDPVLFTATVKTDGSFDVAVPTTTRKIAKYPLQTPWGPGTKIDVGYFDARTTLQNTEGKPFTSPHKVAEGRITAYGTDGRYQVEYRESDGKVIQKEMTMDEIKKYNAPHYFSLRGDRFSDVTINIQTDADLKTFLDGADPIIQRFLPTDGSLLKLSAPEIAKRQRECVAALMAYTHDRVKYPAEGASADVDSQTYHKLEASGRFSLGELVKIKKGVCRHQCILEHLLLQKAGIDSRLASGSANTGSGDFRGLHIWTELTLADDARYLSDQTWNDVAIPLWEGAYSVRKERVEMYDRTSRYDANVVN